MGRRGGNKGLPAWYRGKLIRDDITDELGVGEREGKLFKQRGLNVTKRNFDSLTDEERERSIKRR